MLTFEQKINVISSFPELERKDVSLGRVNFHYEGSAHDKKTVVYHLHPGGNGFVYAGLLDDVKVDSKGLVNIRDYSEEELRELVARAIEAMSEPPAAPFAVKERKAPSREEDWISSAGAVLTVRKEEDLWCIYAGLNLDMAFESYNEVVQYMEEEEFQRK
ncbi:hypothetical protein ACX93W_23270 [Paenibacillus sp. CAU 1782]